MFFAPFRIVAALPRSVQHRAPILWNGIACESFQRICGGSLGPNAFPIRKANTYKRKPGPIVLPWQIVIQENKLKDQKFD